jgi:peptide-methionine (S)-S-oxide reductase
MKRLLYVLGLITVLLAFPLQADDAGYETAVLAGGCFWCIESDYEKLEGVVEAVSGYTGGTTKNPTYRQVSAGIGGHIEAVRVTYDPKVLSYRQIVDYFWRLIDPTRDDGQFCDTGPQYRPVIFYQSPQQKTIAEASQADVASTKPFKDELKVALVRASEFYPAEEYHQDYYRKNPIRYKFYRYNCGRDSRVEALWGKP